MKQTSQKHSLEILVEKIRDDLSDVLTEQLIVGNLSEDGKNISYVGKFVGRHFFIGGKKYEAVLIAEEVRINARNKKITFYPFKEGIEKIIKKYREQYMMENPDVSYFT